MVKIEVKINENEKADWVVFGKYIINRKLLNKNIFLMKYKSYAPSKQFKRRSISDNMVYLINNLLDTGNILYDVAKQLMPNERELFIAMIDKSNTNINIDIKKLEYTDNELKERFNILIGEIQADHNAPSIIHELEDMIIPKLILTNQMDIESAEELLEVLKQDLKA